MELLRRSLLSSIVGLCLFALQRALYQRMCSAPWTLRRAGRALWLRRGYILLTAWLVFHFGIQLLLPVQYRIGAGAGAWTQAVPILYLVALCSVWLYLRLRGPVAAREAAFSPARRAFLRSAVPAVAAAPLVISTVALAKAQAPATLQVVDVRIPGLPRDLDGLRIAQLTDIHYGPFFGKRQLEYAVAMANETRPHIAVVTGDLITWRGDNELGCLDVLKALRGDAGVWACHGNHEQYSQREDAITAEAARRGIRYLRQANEGLRFGGARLNLVGVDYQRFGDEPLPRAEEWMANDALNVLLCHTPASFDRAAQLGFDLTISGHTHGGQLNLAIGEENLTFGRLYTAYIRGLYHKDGKQLYVSRGLGTVGVPMRLGADPEVTLLRLCAG